MRDDLCVTVPSFFRCPITLDVMRSPVSLSTGVTYDRESIQRWLDDGNDTCPATMQILQTKDLVPNLNLQRLIQIWSDSVRHRRVDSRDDSLSKPLSSVLTRDQVLDLILNSERERSDSGDSLADSLSKIVCFARESAENRTFLASEAAGFVPLLAEILGRSNNAGDSGAIAALEMAVRALDTILTEIVGEVKARLASSMNNSLRSLVTVLRRGSKEARIESARVMEAFAAVDDTTKAAIAESDEALSELLRLIGHDDEDASVVEAGLVCLVAVASLRRARARMVRLGAVGAAARCLAKGSLSAAAAEKALRLLEAAASVREGRREIGAGEAGCVERVVERVLKVSRAATEHAVTVLWSVCCVHGCGGAALAAAARANGAAKMLLLIQTDCAPAVRQMAADLLKALRLSGAKSPAGLVSFYETNTTHIMPF